jgi:hypothetical protein
MGMDMNGAIMDMEVDAANLQDSTDVVPAIGELVAMKVEAATVDIQKINI